MSTEIASLYARIGADLSGLQTGLAGARNQLSQAGGEMKAIGMGLSLGVTLPIVGIGTAAFAAAADFEQSMSRIRGLTNTTEEQFKGMSASVLALSKDTGQSPKELADALYFISSSGLQGAAAMDVLKASAKASASGLGETKTVADAVTTAINAYGPANLSAAHAVDVLTQAVIEGKGEPEEFAGAFGRVLPIASAAGVTFDEVAASMATMTRTGLSTEEAATALRGILGALVAPGKQATDTLADLGLSTNALRAEIRDKGLLNALADLNDRANKAAGGMNLSAAGAVVNTKALSAMSDKVTDLTSKIALEEKNIKAETAAIAEAGGKHKWTAAVMQEHKLKLEEMNRTLSINKRELGQAQAAQAGLAKGTQKSTLAGEDSIAILDKVIPNIRALTGVLSSTVAQGDSYKTTLDNIKNSTGAMGKAYDVASHNASFAMNRLKSTLEAVGIEMASTFLPQITPIINMLADRLPAAIQEASRWFESLPAGAQQLITVLGIVAVAAGPVLVILGVLATVLGALLSPIGLVVLALAGLAAAWSLNLGGIQEITAGAFAQVRTIFQSALTTISSTIQAALTNIQGWWNDHGQQVMGIVRLAMDTLQLIVGQVLGAMEKFWIDHGAQIMATLQGALQTVQDLFGQALGFVMNTVQAGLAGVYVWWVAHGSDVLATVGDFMGQTLAVIGSVLGFVANLVQGALAALSAFWSAHGAEIISFVQAAFSTIVALVGGALGLLGGIISGALGLIQGFWAGHGAQVIAIFSGMWNLLSGIVGTALSLIKGFITGWASNLQFFWETFGGTISRTWDLLWKGLLAIATDIGNMLGAVMGIFAALLTGQWTELGVQIRALWDATWQLVGDILGGAIGLILTLVASLIRDISSAWNKTDWGALGHSIVDGIIAGLRAAGSALSNAMSDILKDALETAKGALGIHSPSRVMAELVGLPMMQGIEQGILGYRNQLARTVDGIMGGLLPNGGLSLALGVNAAGGEWAGGGMSGAGGSRVVHGDTYNIVVNGKEAATQLMASIDERRTQRLNGSMGI